jgi:hypothetical protein
VFKEINVRTLKSSKIIVLGDITCMEAQGCYFEKNVPPINVHIRAESPRINAPFCASVTCLTLTYREKYDFYFNIFGKA